MKKVVCRVGKKGFTLVELLVVIAIIGILAGMLFPAIAGAMANSKATKVGNDGKQIWLMLYAENTDRVALNLSEVWPESGNANYADACEFFEFAMNDTNSWLQGLPPSMIGAPGLSPTTSWTNIAAGNLAWCMVKDLTSGSEADTPFLFTKNMSNGQNYPASEAVINTIDQFFALGKPFGESMGVIVTWGGGIRVMKKKQAKTTTTFKALFNPNVNTTLKILAPA